ncbi:MAG: hypothetical protein ABI818_14235 [Acidobacteriota bacterium]
MIYTASAQGCGGQPNAFYSYDLATKKASIFQPAGGGLWGRRGDAIDPEGRVYIGTGAARFDAASQVPRQWHRGGQDRREQARRGLFQTRLRARSSPG